MFKAKPFLGWRKFASSLLLLVLGAAVSTAQVFDWMLPRDSNGWSILTPSSDSSLIYVSASQGNDSTAQNYTLSQVGTDPRDPAISVNAYATIGAALNQMRDGYPDWILLLSGDNFGAGINIDGVGSGRSASERMVATYYQDGSLQGRPVLTAIASFGSPTAQDNWAFVGLRIYDEDSDPDSSIYDPMVVETGSSSFFSPGTNILFEDCVFNFNELKISGELKTNIEVRRNILSNTYYTTNCTDHVKRPSGIFTLNIHNFLFEENVIDHSGWNATISGAGRNQYNHNLYMSYDMTGDNISRGNINARASGNAAQWRSGAVLEKNLYLQGPAGVFLGHEYQVAKRVRSRFNVMLEGLSMGSCPESSGANGGLSFDGGDFVEDVLIEENIVAHNLDYPATLGIEQVDKGVYIDNIVYDWRPSEDQWDPTWLDPERTVGDYHASIGGTGTTEAFIEAVSARGLREWPTNLTAYAVINYIREGFNLAAISPGPEATVNPTGVTLSESYLSMYPGWEVRLHEDVAPLDVTNWHVSWSSSDPSVATVDDDGIVTAVSAGTTTITVTTEVGSYTASANVVVTDSAWVEDFDGLTNGATVDTGDTAWSASSGGGYFAVYNNRFYAQNLGPEAVWTSEVIDISGDADVYITWDTDGDMEQDDYARAYYKLDGGPETLIFENLGNFSEETVFLPVNGSTLQIILRIRNSAEEHFVEEVSVLRIGNSAAEVQGISSTGSIDAGASPVINFLGTGSDRDIKENRTMSQGFALSAATTVNELRLSYGKGASNNVSAGRSFTFQLFPVADADDITGTNGHTPSGAMIVSESGLSYDFPTTSGTLILDLGSLELPAGEYAWRIIDESNLGIQFSLIRSNAGFADGVLYDSADTTTGYDFRFAIGPTTVVPSVSSVSTVDPSTSPLISFLSITGNDRDIKEDRIMSQGFCLSSASTVQDIRVSYGKGASNNTSAGRSFTFQLFAVADASDISGPDGHIPLGAMIAEGTGLSHDLASTTGTLIFDLGGVNLPAGDYAWRIIDETDNGIQFALQRSSGGYADGVRYDSDDTSSADFRFAVTP
jgi:hypothetical protein